MTYKITKFQTKNFRNLSNQIISFNEKINCIIGNNGNGKTNILEAIYYMVYKKSFRKNNSFPQCLSIDGDTPEISFSAALLNNERKTISLSSKITNSSNSYYLDGNIIKKRPDLELIMVNPFDSYQFHNSKSFRRNWMDDKFSQLDIHYKKTLKKYNNILKFRNNLLSKRPSKFLDQIKSIDLDFAILSFELIKTRCETVNNLNKYLQTIFNSVFEESIKLEIVVNSKFKRLSVEEIHNALQSGLNKDCSSFVTSYGVHRDDYILLFNGMNIFEFCSLGQQKMGYLSLLFAYIKLFRYKFKYYPIVLIDDISGELDQIRWSKLIQYLKDCEFQVLITTANERFKEELLKIKNANNIYVSSGEISTIDNI
jgi:DNA replication and repair protein RecF